MKYKCTHCSHTFELSERDFQRCPNCFWTTSLVSEQAEGVPKQVNILKSVTADQPKSRVRIPIKLLATFVVIGLLAALFFVLNQKGFLNQVKIKTSQPAKKEAPAKILNPNQVSKALSESERTQLSRPFQITIPRQITEDEEKILKKEVSFPAKLAEKPGIAPWKKKDFEKMLTSEQKKRKIQLGWGYEKSLINVFEKNYPAAVKAFEQGNYAEARIHFIDSLAFPVYRNNRQLHRAVALVILRPYINDVIGKIAILNQHLVGQNYLTEVNAIFAAYQALFPVLELQEWDKTLTMMTQLKDQIKAFEQKPKDQTVPFPPSFNALDQEIQNAIQAEASPKPDAAINLKALTVDLNLKEKIVRSNTSGELANIQKQYQQALSLIEQGDWNEARNILQAIEFPPELVEDIRIKLEIIEKILALTNSDQNQTASQK